MCVIFHEEEWFLRNAAVQNKPTNHPETTQDDFSSVDEHGVMFLGLLSSDVTSQIE